jgi:hypothetical protein
MEGKGATILHDTALACTPGLARFTPPHFHGPLAS